MGTRSSTTDKSRSVDGSLGYERQWMELAVKRKQRDQRHSDEIWGPVLLWRWYQAHHGVDLYVDDCFQLPNQSIVIRHGSLVDCNQCTSLRKDQLRGSPAYRSYVRCLYDGKPRIRHCLSNDYQSYKGMVMCISLIMREQLKTIVSASDDFVHGFVPWYVPFGVIYV